MRFSVRRKPANGGELVRERLRAFDRRVSEFFTPERFYQAFGLLGLLCVAMACWNVVLWNDNRDLKQRIALLESQRAAEEKAALTARRVEIDATHGRCIGSIKSTKLANTIVAGLKEFLLQSAGETERLIQADPMSPETAVRRAIVRKRREDAASLEPFPTVTKEQCDNNRDSALRAAGLPVAKKAQNKGGNG